MTATILVLAASFAASALAIRWLKRHAQRMPHALPDGRGLHEGRIPRAGGLAIWAGLIVLPFAPVALPAGWSVALAWAAAVAAVSFADDLRGVPVTLRLGVQLVAAASVAAVLFGETHSLVLLCAVALVIAWGSNLYNFMDGSDGLAAAMGIAGFTAFGIAAAHAGAPWLAYAIVVAACVPFFVVNRPPASMFMGDVGSVPLGFLAAASGFAGVAASTWPAWFPVLVFLPFVADATLTLLARALRRERVWRPHREHYYQRLHRLGAGHAGTLAIYGAAMLACSALAITCLMIAPERGGLALAIAAAAHLIGFVGIDYHWRNNKARD